MPQNGGVPRDLPFPVAILALRAHNVKSAKDRHDTAYYAARGLHGTGPGES